jgi:hypothetical protein
VGIREFGSLLFFVSLVAQAQSSSVKNQSKLVTSYIKSILLQDKAIRSSGLLEKVSANSEKSFARYELYFDGINTRIEYVPFTSEESYTLSLVRGNLSAQDSKKKVVMSYSGSQAHLFSYIDRAFREIRGDEKGVDSFFDVMSWKMETKKQKTLIEAVARRDFPVQLLRMEFDENRKLILFAIEMKTREAYALWSDK